MSSFLFTILFWCGLAILWGGFFLLVPEQDRSHTAYLNMAVASFIFIFSWVKYSILFPKLKKAGDNLIGVGIYWQGLGIYICACLAVMLLGFCFKWDFKVQLLLQVIALFVFALWSAFATFAVEHAAKCSEEDQKTISGVRDIQQTAMSVSIGLNALSDEYSEEKRLMAALAEELQMLSGLGNPAASGIDNQILSCLDKLDDKVMHSGNKDEMRDIMKKISVLIQHRKTLRNV